MAAADLTVRLILALAAAFTSLFAGEFQIERRWAGWTARPPAAPAEVRPSSRERAVKSFGGRTAWLALPAAERERILTLFDAFDAARAADDPEMILRAMQEYVEEGLPGRYRSSIARTVAKRLAERGEVEEALEVLSLIKPGEPWEPKAALRAARILYDAGRTSEARARLRGLKVPKGPQSARYGGVDDAYEAAKLMAYAGDRERARQFYTATTPADDAASGRRFMFLGRTLAFELQAAGPGALPESYNFQANLIRKHPDLAGPEDLSSLRRLAWNMAERGETDMESRVEYEQAADDVLDLMKARFPDHPETARNQFLRAFEATNGGDYEKAAAELTDALRSKGLTERLRSQLLLEVDRLGGRSGIAVPVPGGGAGLRPAPDPAFGPGPESREADTPAPGPR